MSTERLINRSCTVIRREASDEVTPYGDKVRDEVSVSTRCELQQRGRGEGEDDISDTRWLAIFLPSEKIHAGYALIVDGETYEVEGEPWRARNPRTQVVSHIEATVRRTGGQGDEVGS